MGGEKGSGISDDGMTRWWDDDGIKTHKSPVGQDCIINRLHLCRELRQTLNECLGYDPQPSDGEDSVMGLWEMGSNPSLLSHSFICTKINVFKHRFLTLMILLNIICLFVLLNIFSYIKWINISIWSIDETPTGSIIPGQCGPGSNDIERVLHIPKKSRTEASPPDCLMPYPGHALKGVLTLCRNTVAIF